MRTRVLRGASIGAGAIILPGTTIGPFAMVGAGTCVIRDVPSHQLVVGHPAKEAGWVCSCGLALNGDLACSDCKRRFQRRKDSIVALE